MSNETCLTDNLITLFPYKIAWIDRYFYAMLLSMFDRVVLELLSPLCTFKNSTKCGKTSCDTDSFQNKRSIPGFHEIENGLMELWIQNLGNRISQTDVANRLGASL